MELEREEVVTAVDRLVEELLRSAGVTAPPVDAIALAQNQLGMVILLDCEQGQRGRAQRDGQRRHIYLRPEPTEERHQWTVAHEIGEHLKVDLLRRLGFGPDEIRPMTGESLANLLAYRLLVPGCWFNADAAELDFDVLALKQRYATCSHEVIAWRLLDLPSPCIITIVDNERISRRRSNAWPTRRRLEPAEVKCQKYVHEHGRPRRVQSGPWTVQGWPVHQGDWKREILRSVIDEC